MDQVERDGLRFPVADHGPPDGPAVLLLHGFPQTQHSWDAVVPALAEAGFRVLVPAQRGYSPTARPAGRRRYVLPELAADALAVADAARLEQVHVVGHDWGAVVAWHLAMHHPARVRTLTALSVPHPAAMARAALRGDQLLRSWYVLAIQLPWMAELGLRAGHGRWVAGALQRTGLPPAHAQRSAALLREPGAATAMLAWYRALPLALRPSARPLPVRVPTLYLWSDGDRYLGRAAAEACERYVAAPFELVVLRGVPHWIPEVAPDEVVRQVLAHVAAHGR